MPNQQNPYTAGVTEVVGTTGFAFRDTFTVGGGGQTVFTTSNEIGNDAIVFENGSVTSKTSNVTGTNQVTTDLMPEGTIVDIIY